MKNKLLNLKLALETSNARIKQLNQNYENVMKEFRKDKILLETLKTGKLSRSLVQYIQKTNRETIASQNDFPALENLSVIIPKYSLEYSGFVSSVNATLEGAVCWVFDNIAKAHDELTGFLDIVTQQVNLLRDALIKAKENIDLSSPDGYTSYLVSRQPTLYDIPATARLNLIEVSLDILDNFAPIDINKFVTDTDYQESLISNLKLRIAKLHATNGLSIDDNGLVTIDCSDVDPEYIIPTEPVSVITLGYNGEICFKIITDLLKALDKIDEIIKDTAFTDKIIEFKKLFNPVKVSSELNIPLDGNNRELVNNDVNNDEVVSDTDTGAVTDNDTTPPPPAPVTPDKQPSGDDFIKAADHVQSYILIITTCIDNIINSAMIWD